MNIGNGFKAIVNVGFWVWIIIGVILIILGVTGGKWTFEHTFLAIIVGVGVPLILKYVLFYIINSFK